MLAAETSASPVLPTAVESAKDEPNAKSADDERTIAEKVKDSLSSKNASNYEFVILAPDESVKSIREQTFVGRWQNRDDYTAVQFDGLAARLDEEVKALLQAARPAVKLGSADK